MSVKKYKIELLNKVLEFLLLLPEKDRAKVSAHIEMLGEDFSVVTLS